MRDLVTKTVDVMLTPTQEARQAAAKGPGTAEAHAAYLNDWPCLTTIEAGPAPLILPHPKSLTVAAWNIERCKRVEDSADLLRRVGADIVLATELDLGMTRSGQRHTTRDLAAELGFGYVFGVEFVELGTGDPYETRLFADVANDDGLHGNAILSRYPLRAPGIIPLDDAGHWFTGSPKSDGQRRIGGRMAICAQIDGANGPLTLCAVHYESESDAVGRAAQTKTLLTGLERAYPGDAPCLIGGDLNTNALTGQPATVRLAAPEPLEPSFSHFRAADFDWMSANTGEITTRAAPGKPVRYPLQTLDWLFVRGVGATAPHVHAALSETGEYLSDHELIATWITL